MKLLIGLVLTGVIIVSLFTWVARALDCLISKVDRVHDREDYPYTGEDNDEDY